MEQLFEAASLQQWVGYFTLLMILSTPGMNRIMAQTGKTVAPTAAKLPTEMQLHGITRVDEYYWMRDPDNPDVLRYLQAENEYLDQALAPTLQLQERLFTEIKNRIQQTDQSVAYPEGAFEYYTRTEEGKQYPIYCRRPLKGNTSAEKVEEQLLLDVNQLAEGKPYCSVASTAPSPDGKLWAYAVDFVGRRKYQILVKDLETQQHLPDRIDDVTGNFVWAEDQQSVFYTRQDPETLRSYQVYRHALGTNPADDVLVYEEPDVEFSCWITKSRSRKYLIIVCRQTLSTECLLMDAENPESAPQVFHPREPNHEYSVDHLGEEFFIRTNWEAENFRLMKVEQANPKQTNWQDVVAASDAEYLDGFSLFDSFLAVQIRRDGMTQVRILGHDDVPSHELEFGEPCFVAYLAPTKDPSTPWLRYAYSSLTTPPSTMDYHVGTREKQVLKEQEVLGGFDKQNYVSQRRFATARDGTQIPVSIVYRRDTPLDGTAPCLQYGYGSYGASMDPYFDANRLNLLDRGFVYAIAHIRGGQEMGRQWYEQGKLLQKMNTFTDFIDVGEFLISEKFADPQRLFARGGSAGGLLIGAVMNLRPDLYYGVIADVPFVDVVTTMLDESIPLTTSEYDEWGNPQQEAFFRYMLAYSPYDNVRPRRYPHVLVTSGLHDSQVQYWEPTKWVARLRDNNLADTLILLRTNLGAGHGGASGRYDRYREAALRDGFLLMLAGRME